MTLALFLFPRAEADLDAHCAFIAQKNIERAFRFDEAAFASFSRLCEMPLLGTERRFANPALEDIRVWFVKEFEKYLIFYRVFGNYIEIIRVLHSAQQIDVIMADEKIV